MKILKKTTVLEGLHGNVAGFESAILLRKKSVTCLFWEFSKKLQKSCWATSDLDIVVVIVTVKVVLFRVFLKAVQSLDILFISRHIKIKKTSAHFIIENIFDRKWM